MGAHGIDEEYIILYIHVHSTVSVLNHCVWLCCCAYVRAVLSDQRENGGDKAGVVHRASNVVFVENCKETTQTTKVNSTMVVSNFTMIHVVPIVASHSNVHAW